MKNKENSFLKKIQRGRESAAERLKEFIVAFQVLSWFFLLLGYSMLIVNNILLNKSHLLFGILGYSFVGLSSVSLVINIIFMFVFFIQKERHKYDYRMQEFYLSTIAYIAFYLFLYFSIVYGG